MKVENLFDLIPTMDIYIIIAMLPKTKHTITIRRIFIFYVFNRNSKLFHYRKRVVHNHSLQKLVDSLVLVSIKLGGQELKLFEIC